MLVYRNFQSNPLVITPATSVYLTKLRCPIPISLAMVLWSIVTRMITNSFLPARVKVWRRKWRHTSLRDVAYLTVVEAKDRSGAKW